MMRSNLIRAGELAARLGDPGLRPVDVRFDLRDPEAGRRAYEQGHVPGATFLDLDRDLSAPVAPDGRGGRHPLPDPAALAARLGALGIGDEDEVVAYDDGSGFAARTWWLLRWIGHERVRVLDGGLPAWLDAGGRLETAVTPPRPASHGFDPDPGMVVDRDWLVRRLDDPSVLLVDARASERYRGALEPIDPLAGHIPGALNRPYAGNLDQGRFLAPAALRRRYQVVDDAEEVVVYCGSGVTAAHDALALEEAGLGMPRLYAGSWSDWSQHDDPPLETGDPETEAAGATPDGGSGDAGVPDGEPRGSLAPEGDPPGR